MGVRQYLIDALEQIDAGVFSSDLLYVPEERAELMRYIARWNREAQGSLIEPAEPPAEQWSPWYVLQHPMRHPVFQVVRRSLTTPKRFDHVRNPNGAARRFSSRSDAWGWILAQGMSQKESISPTGRSLSPGPNMQSMPLHTDEAARVRAAFKKEPTT